MVELWKPSIELVLQKYWNIKNVPHDVLHIALQYSLSYALLTLSDNWKPFEPGFNCLIKTNVDNFDIHKLKLLHYCGVDADNMLKSIIPEYFETDE